MLLLINQNSMNSKWTAYEQHMNSIWTACRLPRIECISNVTVIVKVSNQFAVVECSLPMFGSDGNCLCRIPRRRRSKRGWIWQMRPTRRRFLWQCRCLWSSTMQIRTQKYTEQCLGLGIAKNHEKPWKTKVAENYTENESNDSNESDTADVNESDFSGNITEEPNESNFSANFSTNATQTEETGPVFALVTCVKVTLCVTLCNIKNNIMLH